MTSTRNKTACMHERTQTQGAGFVLGVLRPLVFALRLVWKNKAEELSTVGNCAFLGHWCVCVCAGFFVSAGLFSRI